MGRDTSPARPLARLVVGAMAGAHAERGTRRVPYVPPTCDTSATDGKVIDPSAVALCYELLRAILIGCDQLDELVDRLHPEVVVWTPSAFATSRDAALAVLEVDEVGVDALRDVTIVVTSTDVASPRVYLEWRLAGRFTDPCFVNDDLLVEPTGRLVETSGVLVATFGEGGVIALHCYHDDFALLEQLVDGR